MTANGHGNSSTQSTRRPANLVAAQGKDGGGSWQTLATLTFNWACTGALVCITGPDAQQWKYIGASGLSGNLTTVFNGTRNVLQLGYTGGRPTSIQDADDLDPTHSGSGYLTGHAIAVSYDGSARVSQISDAVRNRFYTPSTITRRWTFTYYSGATCNGVAVHVPQRSHPGLAQPAVTGCTTITPPDQDGLSSPAARPGLLRQPRPSGRD